MAKTIGDRESQNFLAIHLHLQQKCKYVRFQEYSFPSSRTAFLTVRKECRSLEAHLQVSMAQ